MLNSLKILLSSNIIDNTNFKKWFGNSVTIDNNGNPMLFYHISPNKFDSFNMKKRKEGFSGKAFFFTPYKEWADKFLYHYKEKYVYTVYLKIENLFDFNNIDKVNKVKDKFIKLIDKNENNKLQYKPYFDLTFGKEYYLDQLDKGEWGILEYGPILESIKKAKFDGSLILENGTMNYMVFNPLQIKSIDNDGTFDIDDKNIYS